MIMVIMVGSGSKCGIPHCHELCEEEDKDGHQSYAFDPAIAGYRAGEARVCESAICRRKKLNAVSVMLSEAMAPLCGQKSGVEEGMLRAQLLSRITKFYPGISLTCMNAVAMMTPEPKYFAMKNAHAGTPMPLCRFA